MYWLTSSNFQKRVEEEKIPYDKWLDKGLIRLCEGNSINLWQMLQHGLMKC